MSEVELLALVLGRARAIASSSDEARDVVLVRALLEALKESDAVRFPIRNRRAWRILLDRLGGLP